MNPSEVLIPADKKVIRQFLEMVLARNIKLVCLDFDLTLTCVHTMGMAVPSQKLLRPMFKELIKQALSPTIGINIAIATFHSMPIHIQELVQFLIDESNSQGAEPMIQKVIPVRGDTNVDLNVLHPGVGQQGKLPHISNCWKDVFGENAPFYGGQVLLVDDDLTNVSWSRHYNMPAWLFKPDMKTKAVLHWMKSFSESSTTDGEAVNNINIFEQQFLSMDDDMKTVVDLSNQLRNASAESAAKQITIDFARNTNGANSVATCTFCIVNPFMAKRQRSIA